MTTRLTALAALFCAMALLGACQGTPPADIYSPYVDLSLIDTGATAGTLLGQKGDTYVSDINSSYSIESLYLYRGASLDSDGKLKHGTSDVLAVEFISTGAVSFVSVDERLVRLALQIERDGTVSAGYLGGAHTGLAGIGRRIPADSFNSGSAWFIFRNDEVATGQVKASFLGYTLAGNFRALIRNR